MSITCIIFSLKIFQNNYSENTHTCVYLQLIYLCHLTKCFQSLKNKTLDASIFVQEVPIQFWAISKLFKPFLKWFKTFSYLSFGIKKGKGLLCDALRKSRGFSATFPTASLWRRTAAQFGKNPGGFRKTTFVFVQLEAARCRRARRRSPARIPAVAELLEKGQSPGRRARPSPHLLVLALILFLSLFPAVPKP